MNKEIGDAIEIFESAHYTVPTYDPETGNTTYTVARCPVFDSVRKIKQRHPDYRAGPVKVYTQEEIDEYQS